MPLNGLDTVADAAQQIVHFVDEHASTIAGNFPDAAAIDAHLQRDIESVTPSSADTDDQDNDPGASDFDTQLRLVVLAAMGRHEDARTLLTTYPAEQTDEPIDRSDRRFIRQLRRWLDAGAPVAPAVEDTLAQLPRRGPTPRPSWTDARAKSKAKKEALAAARAKSKGKSLDQLKELIAAEYGDRGIEIAPSIVDVNAEMLRSEQQPFGRARTALKAIRMLKSTGADAIRLIKHASDVDPAWLQPPDRAAYPVIAARDRHTSVELDAEAHDWLERVRAEAPRRLGPWILIDVWLTREDPAGPLVAYVGEQRVGTVSQTETKAFDHALRAAALFDEDLLVEGRLTSADGTGAAVLEIPLPERLGAATAT